MTGKENGFLTDAVLVETVYMSIRPARYYCSAQSSAIVLPIADYISYSDF
jgi:hypothetical protein